MMTMMTTTALGRTEATARGVVRGLLRMPYADLVELAREQGSASFHGSIRVEVHAEFVAADRSSAGLSEVSMKVVDEPDRWEAIHLDLGEGEEAGVVELIRAATQTLRRLGRYGSPFWREDHDRSRAWLRDRFDDELTSETEDAKTALDATRAAIATLKQAPSSAARSAHLVHLVAEEDEALSLWGDLLSEAKRRESESAHDRMARRRRRGEKDDDVPEGRIGRTDAAA